MTISSPPPFTTLPLSCRCKQLKVTVDVPTSSLPLPLILCHCNTCNAVTGQLCATVVAVPHNSKSLTVTGTPKSYRTSKALNRFFCETCGTSLYEDASGMAPGLIFLDTGAFEVGSVLINDEKVPVFELKEHIFVSDAPDGGLRDWLTNVPAWEGWMGKSTAIPEGTYYNKISHDQTTSQSQSSSDDELECACKCRGVAFSITRPKNASTHWPPPNESETVASPVSIPRSPEHAWFTPQSTRYNAFLCACNDCRASSGYEASAWAIIPKTNFRASFSTSSSTSTSTRDPVSPVNVSNLQSQSTMRDHESSPGVHRQFCGTCGATLSFYNAGMPSTMNVAVGLMKGRYGPRVEEWLCWATGEVGYASLAQNSGFVGMLEEGLRTWGARNGKEEERVGSYSR